MVPTIPSGTLNQKTHCQLSEVSHPPSTGPTAVPTATTVPLMPSARPSSRRGKASVTMAPLLAIIKAPPMPATTRSTISSQTLSANPLANAITVNSANPAV